MFNSLNTGAANASQPQGSTSATQVPALAPVPPLGQASNSASQANNNGSLLKDLLESASNFPKSGLSDLGSIQLTIPELQKKTNLLRRSAQKAPSSFTRAHYILASSGISADDIETELNSLGSQEIQNHLYGGGFGGGFGGGYHGPKGGFGGGFGGGFDWDDGNKKVQHQHHQEQSDDLDSYLSSKKDENILAAIELSLTSASKDFDNFVLKNISIDWKVRKDQLRKNFGVTSGETNNASSRSSSSASNGKSFSWNKANNNSYNYNLLSPLASKPSSNYSSKQLTREKFESHAQIVYQLNEARFSESFYPLAMSFEEVSKSNSDLKSRQVGDSWKILVNLTDEKSSKMSQEKKFKDVESGKSKSGQIIKTSKSYLESQFYDYLDNFYNKDEDKDKLPPTNINKVIHFINKVNPQSSSHPHRTADKSTIQSDLSGSNTLTINGVPIWALIFYLLRAGLYHELNEIVFKNQASFNKFDKNFPVYLKTYLETGGEGLPIEQGERIQKEFNQQFQFINEDMIDSYDVYKYSVYKIIGKCELSKKSLPRSINLSIEDWIWFHLSLVNEVETSQKENTGSLIFDTYTLEDLQKKIVQWGPKRFNSSSNNPLYLKTLVLCGLYELAVQYTFEYIDECDAVHLAIGLSYYGLLRTCNDSATKSKSNYDSLVCIEDGELEVNLSRLLASYTRTFKFSDPKVACQYAILIALEPTNIETCQEAIRELVLLSREFAILLGSINSANGERYPGILEKQRSLIGLEDLEAFNHVIIEKLANRCEEEGRIFDSILLYQLSQEYNTVILLLNKLLGEILSTTPLDKPLYKLENGSDTADNNIVLLAKHILTTFQKNTHILDLIIPSKKESLSLLISIVDIRSSFLDKDWALSLQKVLDIGIIPISERLDLISIRRSAELVSNSLDDSVIKVIPSLLIISMTCFSQLNYAIITQKYNTSSNEREELENIQKMAKNCMIYAGMVQYKMPRETYSLLVNLEALM